MLMAWNLLPEGGLRMIEWLWCTFYHNVSVSLQMWSKCFLIYCKKNSQKKQKQEIISTRDRTPVRLERGSDAIHFYNYCYHYLRQLGSGCLLIKRFWVRFLALPWHFSLMENYSATSTTCCPWSHWLRPKKLLVSVAMPPAPVRVPSQRPLAPMVASVTTVANDNERILGTVRGSPGICRTAEEKPRKPQLGDRPIKGLCDQSSPQMGSLSSKWGR